MHADSPALLVLASASGWTAVTVGLVAAWPQVLRLARSGRPDGVSWSSSVLGVGTVLLWLAYGLAAGDPVQVVNNLLSMAAALATCALLVRHAGVPVLPAVTALVVLALLTALAWWLGGAAAVAVAASALSVVKMWPQVLLVCRAPSARLDGVRTAPAALVGLSPASTLLGVLAALLWLAYGSLSGDLAVQVTSSVASALAGVVLWRRLPPVATVRSLAAGRLGPRVATATRTAVVVAGPATRTVRRLVPVVAPGTTASDVGLAA